MSDVAQTSTGDWAIDNVGDTNFTTGIAAIRQDLDHAFKLVKGDNIYAPEEGVPLFEQILGRPATRSIIRQVFMKVALDVPGITEVYNFVPTFNGVTRLLTIDMDVSSVAGDFHYNEDVSL